MTDDIVLLQYETVNAALGWLLTGVALLVAVESALGGDLLWAGLALAVVALALVPPVHTGSPTEMIAWEATALAALPLVTRSLGLFAAWTAYLTVAALALVVAVELDAFTDVEMTPDFAVAFVVVVTAGVAGLWTIAQFASDVYLGTSLLGTQTALMWDLVVASAVGVLAGGVFELYFRRVSRGHPRSTHPRQRGVDDYR